MADLDELARAFAARDISRAVAALAACRDAGRTIADVCPRCAAVRRDPTIGRFRVLTVCPEFDHGPLCEGERCGGRCVPAAVTTALGVGLASGSVDFLCAVFCRPCVRIAIGTWAALRGRVECVGFFAPLLRAAFAAAAGEASAYCGLLGLCNKLSALGRPLRPPEADILAYISAVLAGAENDAAAVPDDDWGESARMEISRVIASTPEVATDVVLVATQVAEATDVLLLALLTRALERVIFAGSGPAGEAAVAVLRELRACDADEAENVINLSRDMVAGLTESSGSATFAMSYACLEAWAARRVLSRRCWSHLRFCD